MEHDKRILGNFPPRSRPRKGWFRRPIYQCAVCRRYSAKKARNNKYKCSLCSSEITYRVSVFSRFFPSRGAGTVEVHRPPGTPFGRSGISKEIRCAVEKRDKMKCRYCGKRLGRGEYELDHVVPYSRGGADTEDNLVISCRACNRKKKNRTPREAKMQLRGLWRHKLRKVIS